MNKALLLIDLQKDFTRNGALEVPYGEEVIPVANALLPLFSHTIATKDWHPANHVSFAPNHAGKKVGDVIEAYGATQVLWPIHCEANTPGAEFAEGLHHKQIQKLILKGMNPKLDSYSGFFDNAHLAKTDLDDYLKDNRISDLYIMGLATDYCVKFTVLDACSLGYNVYLIEDGCRGVDVSPGDVEQALLDMEQAGAQRIQSQDL